MVLGDAEGEGDDVWALVLGGWRLVFVDARNVRDVICRGCEKEIRFIDFLPDMIK